MRVMQIIASASLIILSKITGMLPVLLNMRCIATGSCGLFGRVLLSFFRRKKQIECTRQFNATKISVVWKMTPCFRGWLKVEGTCAFSV